MGIGRLHGKPGRARKFFEDLPPERDAFAFELFSMAGVLLLSIPVLGPSLKAIGRAIGALLTALSPAMPFEAGEDNSFSSDPKGFYWRILSYTVPITLFFCYVL